MDDKDKGTMFGISAGTYLKWKTGHAKEPLTLARIEAMILNAMKPRPFVPFVGVEKPREPIATSEPLTMRRLNASMEAMLTRRRQFYGLEPLPAQSCGLVGCELTMPHTHKKAEGPKTSEVA